MLHCYGLYGIKKGRLAGHRQMTGEMYMLLFVILIVYNLTIYSIMATVSTCKYCCQQVRRCDYEEHIGRSCPDLPMECVFECGEYIARKMMKQHCQQQCNNAKRMILSQQQDDKFVITCIAVQETDE